MVKGNVLIIAGSDSGAGAGIQADIKTCAAFSVYATTAVTAVTVQDTRAVHAVHPVPPSVIAQQVRVVLSDVGADVIKIGMIGSVEAGEAILSVLPDGVPIVLDPVLVATSGDSLGGDGMAAFLRERLLPRAAVVTPNVPELTALSGEAAGDAPGMERAARTLLAGGAGAILAKGGHLDGDGLTDLLVTAEGTVRIEHERIDGRSTHGTGCTLASAVAAGLAQGLPLEAACRRGVDYVAAAIQHAPGLGQGHRPLNHALREGPDGFVPI